MCFDMLNPTSKSTLLAMAEHVALDWASRKTSTVVEFRPKMIGSDSRGTNQQHPRIQSPEHEQHSTRMRVKLTFELTGLIINGYFKTVPLGRFWGLGQTALQFRGPIVVWAVLVRPVANDVSRVYWFPIFWMKRKC